MSMEGFSAAQIAHAQATGLQFFVKGPLFMNGIQQKPTLAKFEASKKEFSDGNNMISLPVKFSTGGSAGETDTLTGFSHTDTVDFYNPGKGRRAGYIWREHHIGMTMSETELKRHGILVNDDTGKPVKPSSNGVSILSNVLDEALRDFAEQYAVSMNALIWGDGSADPSAMSGLQAFILDIPTMGKAGGITSAANPRWRNRAYTRAFSLHSSFDAKYGGDRVTSSAANGGALLQVLQTEWRQLRRYGGKPDCFAAGSDFIAAMETEMRANGTYSMDGFTGKQDGSVGDMMFKGVSVYYDPTLDDLGRSKYAYIWDSSDIFIYALAGDWRRPRQPARPYDQFVFYQSLLCTGQMVARRRNSSLVIQIA